MYPTPTAFADAYFTCEGEGTQLANIYEEMDVEPITHYGVFGK